MEVVDAVKAVHAGQLIAYPTEAVYGLGCDPGNVAALDALLALKGRDATKGFIVIAATRNQLDPFVGNLSASDETTLAADWPGPVTWIVPAADHLPPTLTGQRTTLAVRVSAHPIVQALCKRCGHALVSTSANPSGREAFRSADLVQDCFGDAIAGVVEGTLGDATNVTRIMDLASGARLR